MLTEKTHVFNKMTLLHRLIGREMNHTPRQYITLEIPSTRKAFWDWYEADRNKRLIYYFALAGWLLILLQLFTVIPLTATSTYRVAFYLPLFILISLLGVSTHWLIQCVLNDYDVSHRHFHHPAIHLDSPVDEKDHL